MNWENRGPMIVNTSKIENLTFNPVLEEFLKKVMEQNRMIIEQNAQILSMITPVFTIGGDVAGLDFNNKE